jgi:hypothetical protein
MNGQAAGRTGAGDDERDMIYGYQVADEQGAQPRHGDSDGRP